MANVVSVTVEYGRVQSLGYHSNVKPLVSLTAKLSEGEDEAQVVSELMSTARTMVEREIRAAEEES